MNNYLGHCWGSVKHPWLRWLWRWILEYRRDNRPVYDRSKQVLETPRHVIPEFHAWHARRSDECAGDVHCDGRCRAENYR